MEYWTSFLLGFAGSLHCAGMCGPLVLALAGSRPRTTRDSAGRVCYHLGRMAVYCALGLAMGLAGHALVSVGAQRALSLAAGVGLLGMLAIPAGIAPAVPLHRGIGWIRTLMKPLIPHPSLASQALLGGLNGLLPCGLVYAAAAAAASTGHPIQGAICMACFGLGTLPLMLGIHLAGHRLPMPSRLSAAGVTRVAVLALAVLLILRGLDLGIPFISPKLPAAAGETIQCH